MPDEVFTLREVADYLKVTERTIYRLVSEKKLPGFKVGGSWRFRKNDIDKWIDAELDSDREAAGRDKQ